MAAILSPSVVLKSLQMVLMIPRHDFIGSSLAFYMSHADIGFAPAFGRRRRRRRRRLNGLDRHENGFQANMLLVIFSITLFCHLPFVSQPLLQIWADLNYLSSLLPFCSKHEYTYIHMTQPAINPLPSTDKRNEKYSCASSPGTNPIHLASARRLAKCLYDADISLVYGGGTKGIMGELARTMVELYGNEAATGTRQDGSGDGNVVAESRRRGRVHGVIPRALVDVEPGITKREDNMEQDTTKDGEKMMRYNTVEKGGGGKEPEREVSAEELQEGSDSHQVTRRDGLPNSLPRSSTSYSSSYGSLSIVPDMHTRKQEMARHVIESCTGPNPSSTDNNTYYNQNNGSGFIALPGGYGTVEEVMEMITWNQLGIHSLPIVLVNVDGYWDGLLAWIDRAVREGFVAQANREIVVAVDRVEEVVGALKGYVVSRGRWELDWERKV